MDDLTATRLCAEAMGWTCKGKDADNFSGETRHFRVYQDGEPIYGIGDGWVMQRWEPLKDDAQAMALVKRFDLRLWKDPHRENSQEWGVCQYGAKSELEIQRDADLNRAIVYCVAKMQADHCAPASNNAAEK